MRNAFFDTLLQVAEADARVFLVVGDLGFGVVEPFARKFPDQYLNAGVAEQNMTGIAAGLALSGKVVFTYSIGNFPTIRCLEQIRNDICYHAANVKIVAVGGGFAYGGLGMSHHATEDLAILRSLPQMTVIAPGDPVEAMEATRAMVKYPGPCYLRLGRAGERVIHSKMIDFQIGKSILLRDGTDMTIISTGGMLETVSSVAASLSHEGVCVRVISMHTIKPLDHESILRAAAETGMIVTVEEHSIVGGLGSAVAELLAETELPVTFKRIGLPSAFSTKIGSQEYLRQQFGLGESEILETLRRMFSQERKSLAIT